MTSMSKPEHFYLHDATLEALERTVLETIRGTEPDLVPPGAEATISAGPMRVGGAVVLTLTFAIHDGRRAPRRRQQRGGKP